MDASVIERLKAAVGPQGWLESDADKAPYLNDERDLYHGAAPLVLRPANTAEVAAVVKICAETGTGIVPQGGNTGYCGGSIPGGNATEIVLSLGRMNKIREIDPLNYTITVEAGCILANIQAAAEAEDRLFPLSLAAEGTCQIGGNLSTNAGGTAVLRYGNTRDLVLGLEAVLPSGEIWHGLKQLRKDNTGYDLKQMFIGSEGTLGIITAAVCKLFPLPRETCVAMVAVRDPRAASETLARLRAASSDAITSFEYMHRDCLDMVFKHIPDTADPFEERFEHYVLIELASGRKDSGLREIVESALAEEFESGAVLNAVIAASEQQAAQLWRLRETIPESQKHHGGCIKHDVSVPVSQVPAFLDAATAAARREIPGVFVVPFGHMGDGNIHFNLSQPTGEDRETFLARTDHIEEVVHDIAVVMDGSFSAEHGVGVLKKGELRRYKSAVELGLMRTIKGVFDPDEIMNRGKIL
ncbi:MAG: FAD-binding oxidoreductase [Alphaproteobacteria bacterium]|nr:FAD-binding oxidoreductase [Alphaproteobacteria bacterium]